MEERLVIITKLDDKYMKTSNFSKHCLLMMLTALLVVSCAAGQSGTKTSTLTAGTPMLADEKPTEVPENLSKGTAIVEIDTIPEVDTELPSDLNVINSQTAGDVRELAQVMPYFPKYYLTSENGRVGAIGGMDAIMVFNLENGELLLNIPVDIQDCAFGMDRHFRLNQDGSFVALIDRDVIQVWQVNGGLIYESAYSSQTEVDTGVCGADIPQLALSPDGSLLAVSGVESGEKYFKAIDILANDTVYTWNGDEDGLHGDLSSFSGLGFSRDGKLLQTFDPTRYFALSGTAYQAFRFWSVETWQEVDGNSGAVREAFNRRDLLFALQNKSDAIMITDRITGQEQSRLGGTGCSLEYPCDVKLSTQGAYAAVMDYKNETVLYHSGVLAKGFKLWNLEDQSLVAREDILARNLDGLIVDDNGGYQIPFTGMKELPPLNSWWTSAYNFEGLKLGHDGRILFSPQQVITSSDASAYYPGTCELDLDDLSINCEAQYYSYEGNAFVLSNENELERLHADDLVSPGSIRLDLTAAFGEGWSFRVLGISEEHQTVFYCLDENKRNQNCMIYDYGAGDVIAQVEDMYALRFSPEGNYAAYINREEKSLFILDLSISRVLKVDAYQSRAWPVNPDFGDNGSELVYMIQNLASQDVISLEWVDADGVDVLRRSNLDFKQILDVSVLSWNSEGELVALGSGSGMIYLLDQARGKLVHSWQAHTDAIIGLAFSADGRLLVSMGKDGRIKVWGVEK